MAQPPEAVRADRWLTPADEGAGETLAAFGSFGITTDEEYLARRAALPEGLQREADRIRYQTLVTDVPPDDPFSVARVAPLSALSIRLADLRLSTRCSKVLQRENVTTLGDLAACALDDVLHDWKNFGRTTARELTSRLRESIERTDGAVDADGASLLACLTEELTHLPVRNAGILSARIGVNGAWRTLEAIAQQHGITRQRVEQIVNRWLESTANRPWRRALLRRLDECLADREQPLYLDLLDSEDAWFAGWPEPLNLGNAIEIFTDNEVRVINVAGLHVVTRLSQQSWDRLPGQVLGYIKSLGPSLTESETRLAVEGFADGHEAKGLGELLYGVIRPRLQFSRQGDETTLSSIGGGLVHHVRAVLDSAESPLHYTEIAARCSARVNRHINPAAVGNFLAMAGAKYYGRGTWGQSRHFALSPEARKILVDEAEGIARSGQPGRQWHLDELLVQIAERSLVAPTVDKYTLNFALETSEVLVPKGRLVWALKSHANRERIDVREACEQLIKERGRPMSRAELVSALKQHRGLGQYLCITPRSGLLRVSPGTWGLLGRDFGLTEDQADSLLERLYDAVASAGQTLHETELRTFLQGEDMGRLSPYMLLSLAQRDPRVWLQRGRSLSLAAWRNSTAEET